jgi:predicted metalloendopeptidase
MTVPDLYNIAPDFNWSVFFSDSGVPKFEILNVSWPDLFKDVNAQLKSASLEDWKTYMRWMWHTHGLPICRRSSLMRTSTSIANICAAPVSFQPRWKRCVQHVDNDLGEALGQAYVRKTFGPDANSGMFTTTPLMRYLAGDRRSAAKPGSQW